MDVCCLIQQNGGAIAECRMSCDAPGGPNGSVLCDLNSPNPDCPTGEQCQPSTTGSFSLPDGVGVCN
jgi:hypothetical protein